MLIVTSALLRRAGAGGRPEVLIGLKKTGFGAGLVNLPGGKVEPGETPAEAAARELWEETGITVAVDDLVQVADIVFRFPDVPEWVDLRLHVFGATVFEGEPHETDEIAVEWLPEAEIPYERMWDDSRVWLPAALAGESVVMDFTYAGRDKVGDYANVPVRGA